MKNKKILAILTISAIVSAAATGCSFGGDEPEEQVVVTETPAPEATATPTPEPTHRARRTGQHLYIKQWGCLH